LLNLKWSEIDFGQRTARLGKTKNGKPRLLPLTQPVIEELMRFRESTGFPGLPQYDQQDDAVSIRQRLGARRFEESGIGHCRFHDLRHTAASNLVRAGRSLFEVGTLLGHSSPQMTQRYSHLAIHDTTRHGRYGDGSSDSAENTGMIGGDCWRDDLDLRMR
jgi:integrase